VAGGGWKRRGRRAHSLAARVLNIVGQVRDAVFAVTTISEALLPWHSRLPTSATDAHTCRAGGARGYPRCGGAAVCWLLWTLDNHIRYMHVATRFVHCRPPRLAVYMPSPHYRYGRFRSAAARARAVLLVVWLLTGRVPRRAHSRGCHHKWELFSLHVLPRGLHITWRFCNAMH
jgi:hypothetical protein